MCLSVHAFVSQVHRAINLISRELAPELSWRALTQKVGKEHPNARNAAAAAGVVTVLHKHTHTHTNTYARTHAQSASIIKSNNMSEIQFIKIVPCNVLRLCVVWFVSAAAAAVFVYVFVSIWTVWACL